jgi:hypothetical protein
MDQKRAAADYERDLEMLFCDENLRLLWSCLDELGVPPHGRGEVMHQVFHMGARTLAKKSLAGFEPQRLLLRMAVHMASHYWDEHPTEMDPEGKPPKSRAMA